MNYMQKVLQKVISDLQGLQAGLEDAQVTVIERNFKGITDREMEMITHVCDGLRGREIAQKMFASLRTIDGYRDNVLRKLHCNTQCQAIALLFKAKILK